MDYSTSSPTDSKSFDFRVNTRYEILTPTGFQPFDGVRKKTTAAHKITFRDGDYITATPEHLLLSPSGWVATKDVTFGGVLCSSDNPLHQTHVVDEISPLYQEDVFDPINVGDGSAYCSGSVVSHNCSFLSSAYTLIKSDVRNALQSGIPLAVDEDGYCEFVAPIPAVLSDDGQVVITPAHTYVMCIDTASGQGLDDSAFAVVDVTEMPYRVVATYANNAVDTMEFPQVIMKHAARYNMPWLLVEVMDIGRDVAHILFREFEYPSFMSTMTEKRLGQRLVFNNRAQRHLGLRMTPGVKRSGCAVLKTFVENNQLVVNDYRIVQQLSTFIQKGSTYKAEAGYHDDLVMPLVMLGWVSLQPNFGEITITRALDTYTKMMAPALGNPEVVSTRDDVPMPIGIFASLEDELNDASWLLR